MKKQVKIVSIILVIMIALMAVSNVVLAAPDLSADIKDMANGSGNQPKEVLNLGKTIVSIMQTVGIVVAVVVLLVLGIKYMMGSAEEKAEYKKTMIPYVVGAVLVFAGTSLVKVIYSLATAVK